MAVPPAVIEAIEAHTQSSVTGFSFAGGGCINHGGKITTSQGVCFLKWNDLKKFPGMFADEARGLELLRRTNALDVPEVIHVGDAGAFQFLLLENIEEAERTGDYWETFGSGLALLHRNTSGKFGLDRDNYIGSLRQRNNMSLSWTDFFIEQRLKVQLQVGHERGKIDSTVLKKFDILFDKIPSLLPEEPSALLHGDLWSGNVMTTSQGRPCLIDPAVYFGHREADLAMTQLFGGFDPAFLSRYHELYPLISGYEQRFDLYNLYPLLVHVNLFGGGYIHQVASVLSRFV